jgi:hypothetical protein
MKATFDALPDPEDREILWLLDQGIDADALCFPWPIRGASVRWFNPDSFDFDAAGERAVIFRAEDRGGVVDLIAWSPRTSKIGSWRGAAVCLGNFDQIHNPATYFDGGALRLHPSPFAWLKADRDGIVLLKPGLAYSDLRGRHVLCDDTHYAASVARWCRPPKSNVKISIAASAVQEVV